MPTEPRPASSPWDPSWRRLAGSTVVLFVVILAFLVGRVRAGADPGLVREASQAPQQQTAPPASSSGTGPQSQAPPSQGFDPNDPFADPQSGQGVDPGTGANGTTDNFGNAVPDGQGSGGFDDGNGSADPGTQSIEPPSTHVS